MKTIKLTDEFDVTIRRMSTLSRVRAVLHKNDKPICGKTFDISVPESEITDYFTKKINNGKTN